MWYINKSIISTSHSRFDVDSEKNVNDPESDGCENNDENESILQKEIIKYYTNVVSLFKQ